MRKDDTHSDKNRIERTLGAASTGFQADSLRQGEVDKETVRMIQELCEHTELYWASSPDSVFWWQKCLNCKKKVKKYDASG